MPTPTPTTTPSTIKPYADDDYSPDAVKWREEQATKAKSSVAGVPKPASAPAPAPTPPMAAPIKKPIPPPAPVTEALVPPTTTDGESSEEKKELDDDETKERKEWPGKEEQDKKIVEHENRPHPVESEMSPPYQFSRERSEKHEPAPRYGDAK